MILLFQEIIALSWAWSNNGNRWWSALYNVYIYHHFTSLFKIQSIFFCLHLLFSNKLLFTIGTATMHYWCSECVGATKGNMGPLRDNKVKWKAAKKWKPCTMITTLINIKCNISICILSEKGIEKIRFKYSQHYYSDTNSKMLFRAILRYCCCTLCMCCKNCNAISFINSFTFNFAVCELELW